MAISSLAYLLESISMISGQVSYLPYSNLVERPIPSGQLVKNQVGHRYEVLGTTPVKNTPMTLQHTVNVNAVGAATQFAGSLHIPLLTYANSTEAESENPLKVDYCVVRLQVISPSLAFDNTSVGYLRAAIAALAGTFMVYDDGSPSVEDVVIKRILRGGTKLV